MPRSKFALQCARVGVFVVAFVLSASWAVAGSGKLSSSRNKAKAASGADSPSNFYRRLTEAITDLDGHAVLYFNPGVWNTKSLAAGGDVHWRIDDGTIGDFTVTYINKALVAAELSFNKPVHIWLPVNGGVSFAVTDLKYDQNGNLISDNRKPDNPKSAHYVGSSRTDRIFGIETTPDMMLKGELFANFDSIAKCDTNNQNCVAANAALVYEVQIQHTPTHPAGLTVSLGPTAGPGIPNPATLPLVLPSRANSSPNYLDLQPGSSLVIDNVDYFVDEHYLKGTLVNLTLRIANGQIGTGDLGLSITAGSTFTVQNLTFTHDPSNIRANRVEADNGYLAAGIARGSQIQLSKASAGAPDAESYIVLRDGSAVELRGVTLRQDDSTGMIITWDNTSHQKVFVQSGVINVGTGAFINLASSSIEMNIAGTWSTGKVPAVSATNVEIDANVNGAQLPINPASVLRLGSGHFHGHNLTIDSTARPVVRGTVSDFDLAILADTTVAFPGAIQLVTRSGGQISLDPSSPSLQFGLGSPYPVGRYILDLPFSIFDNGSTAKNFELTDGYASLPLETLADGTIQTPSSPTPESWTISGKMSLYPSGGTPLNIDAAITAGKFHTTFGGHPSFSGMFAGTAKKGFVWSFTTPSLGLKGQPSVQASFPVSNVRVYPVALTLGLSNDAIIPPTAFSIGDNGMGAFIGQFNASFVLTPAPGRGEHEQDDDADSADGTHGSPDPPVHGQQEVLQLHAGAGGDFVAGCQGHVYVAPVQHNGSLNAQITLDSSHITVGIARLEFEHPFAEHADYEKDGCDATPILSVIGAVTLGLPGIVGGVVLGNAVNNRVDDLVRERVNAFATGLAGKSWSFRYVH